jgi:ADP-ribose pyrophosphatase YjhB (NUDIX family)
VLAYITCQQKLLVFRHSYEPEAGIQVPAGTIEEGEPPEQAVLCEAFAETGLTGLMGSVKRKNTGEHTGLSWEECCVTCSQCAAEREDQMQRVLVPEGMLYLSLLEEQDETWEEESRCAGSEHFFARNTSEESEALLRAVYTRLQTDGKRSYFPEEPDESGRMGSQNATWDSFSLVACSCDMAGAMQNQSGSWNLICHCR